MDVFDKIIEGELPSAKVYEDDDVIAILDLNQITKGHTLLIPKQHVENIYEYDEELAARVLAKIPMLARAIKATDPKIQGMNILSNNGTLAGQTVMHSHWHIIPRYIDGDYDIPMPEFAPVAPEELARRAEAIKANLHG